MTDRNNQHTNLSPRVPRRATQVVDVENLTPERKAALKVPPHASQALPEVLRHAEDEMSTPVPIESNFVVFEKHLLANHIGSLGDCMIYEKETSSSHRDDDPQKISQITPHPEAKPKLNRKAMKEESGSFDLAAEIYSDH